MKSTKTTTVRNSRSKNKTVYCGGTKMLLCMYCHKPIKVEAIAVTVKCSDCLMKMDIVLFQKEQQLKLFNQAKKMLRKKSRKHDA